MDIVSILLLQSAVADISPPFRVIYDAQVLLHDGAYLIVVFEGTSNRVRPPWRFNIIIYVRRFLSGVMNKHTFI